MKNHTLENSIRQIVDQPELHAKWLNTLSMMENCGARKISAGEHSQKVDLIVLKHAAEEARHAYYLKNQITKTTFDGCETYDPASILAPVHSFQYLHQLDVAISRFLKKRLNFTGTSLKYASYLLVTYAIEVRADKLYPVYEQILKEKQSNISVRMIIAEEKGHLEEMIAQMESFFDQWEDLGTHVVQLENKFYKEWIDALEREVQEYYSNLQEVV